MDLHCANFGVSITHYGYKTGLWDMFREYSLSHCSRDGLRDSNNGPNGERNTQKSTYQ